MDKEFDKLKNKINNLKFLSDEDIKNANFYELAIYLEKLNGIDKVLKQVSCKEQKDGVNYE